MSGHTYPLTPPLSTFLNDPMAQVAAHCLANDSFSLFIGSDNGLVYNVPIRQGQRSSPKTYLAEIDNTSACRSIDFCPFGKDFILVGKRIVENDRNSMI